MGHPWFETLHLEESEGLIALSANFAFYGDLSDRIASITGEFGLRQEFTQSISLLSICPAFAAT